jgi:hypothetical protein
MAMKSQSTTRQRLWLLALLCALSTSLAVQSRILLQVEELRMRQSQAAADLAAWSASAVALRADLQRSARDETHPLGAPVQQAALVFETVASATDQGVRWDAVRFPAQKGARNPKLSELFRPLALGPGLSAVRLVLSGEYLGIEGLGAHLARLRSAGAAIVDLSLEGKHVELGLAVLARTAS